MIISSNELRAAGFKLKEVLPPALELHVQLKCWKLHVVVCAHEERDYEV
jgi:hypothetical protein